MKKLFSLLVLLVAFIGKAQTVSGPQKIVNVPTATGTPDVMVRNTTTGITSKIAWSDFVTAIVDAVGGGSSQTLTQTLANGNETDGENIIISNGDAIVLDNGAKLKKGTVNNGFGGGISRVCVADKEDQWENGVRYLRPVGGTNVYAETMDDVVPDASYDDVAGWAVGSTYKNLVTGDVYKCTDATTGSAVWELALSGVPTLQQVLDNNNNLSNGRNHQGSGAGTSDSGNEVNAFGSSAATNNSGESLNAFGSNAGSYNTGINVNAFGNTSAFTNTGSDVNAFGSAAGNLNTHSYVNLFGNSTIADDDFQTVFSKYVYPDVFQARLSYKNITADRKWELPDNDGTVALLSDLSGFGTVTDVLGTTNRITSTGGTTPAIDISSTFEALLGKVANRIDQNNASTTSAQLASTISNETGTGVLVFGTSPTLSNPVVGTQSASDNSTKAASTAYVDTADLLKANLASPTFTGTPNAPTQSANDNTTKIATTAYADAKVQNSLSASTTIAPSATAVNTGLDLKANLAGPTFTGTVTTPAIIVSSETASRVAIIDASNNVKSADIATYPSLTELAYTKGITSNVQLQIDSNNFFDTFHHEMIWAAGGNTISVIGHQSAVSVGTGTARTLTNTNAYTATPRYGMLTTSSAGNVNNYRISTGLFIPSSIVSFEQSFGTAEGSSTSGQRFIIGIFTDVSSLTSNIEYNTLTNLIGVCRLSGSNNLQVIYNDASGTATTVDLGSNFPVNVDSGEVYKIKITPISSSSCTLTVYRKGTAYSDTRTISTDIPALDQLFTIKGAVNNNANATIFGIDFMKTVIKF